MEGTITISVKEYRDLVEAAVRIKVFENFVNGNKYSIERWECARFFGFELKEKED